MRISGSLSDGQHRAAAWTLVAPPEPADVVAEAYDAFAGRYDDAFSSARCRAEDALLKRTLERFLTRDVETVLDVGCGTGLFLRLLGWPADCYTGLDVSSEMLRRARQCYPRASFLHGSAERMPVADATMDVVVSLYAALSYVAAPMQAVDEIFRVLVPGGRCFLMVYAPRWYSRGTVSRMGTVNVFTAPAAWSCWQAVQRMGLAGFHDVRLSGFSLLPTPLIHAEAPLARRFPGWGRYLIVEGTRR